MLDTSFLITFSDPSRPHHTVARQYFKECVHRQVPMYLSTIAVSEFQVRQAINDLPMRSFIVLPFNVDHAMACGLLHRRLQRDPEDGRVVVKDDFKLIAQCECEGITHLLSEDRGTLAKYLERARATSPFATQVVLLRDGFDTAWFDNGQTKLPL
ncbi:hypothetical protein [Hydrogenophaga sp.]|uniref:type II toxin-antitoxin system VapC family toxin n=1 Tax=Hydrogenophaga sp. TaxID=1904254 RepID=UPI00257BDE27|nr:hypothetical protein [Hydrogenophaga sp.]